ncbi:unnamed protein product [Allacma fusca]|uniref:Uncharacterized protein n=1 Tax=Allacma fusca TaxID=39272 RepID=A0A8J2JRG8_9HEXA|nr:unnamed protein product [Allacma fusca]
MHKSSLQTLRSWKRMRNSLLFRKFLRSCRPVQLASWFFTVSTWMNLLTFSTLTDIQIEVRKTPDCCSVDNAKGWILLYINCCGPCFHSNPSP